MEAFFEVRTAYNSSAIRVILSRDEVFNQSYGKKLVGLFDFDTAYNDWKGTWSKNHIERITDPAECLTRKHPSKNGWVLLLPVPLERSHLASIAMGGKDTSFVDRTSF